jgi:O-methyltransferase
MNDQPRPRTLGGLKTLIWRRMPGVPRSALWAAYSVVRSTPVERCPAPLARLLGIKVPRSGPRNPEKSPLGESNIKIIFELLGRASNVPGHVAECGIFRGASVLAIGLYVKQHLLSKVVHGFDSFEGFGESVEFDLRLGGQESADKRVGGFNETSYELVREKIARFDLEDVVQLHKGFFASTLPECSEMTFSFVHLDCDIFESYKECLNFFYPRTSPGGIILFDEYNDPPWPGCNLAIDEFLADKPERPIEIEIDNFQKWYIQMS